MAIAPKLSVFKLPFSGGLFDFAAILCVGALEIRGGRATIIQSLKVN